MVDPGHVFGLGHTPPVHVLYVWLFKSKENGDFPENLSQPFKALLNIDSLLSSVLGASVP